MSGSNRESNSASFSGTSGSRGAARGAASGATFGVRGPTRNPYDSSTRTSSSQQSNATYATNTTTATADASNYGRATATVQASNSAIKLCDAYRRKLQLPPLAQSTQTEFEGDNLERFFLDYSSFLSSTPIPKHGDEDLQATNGKKDLVMMSTLSKYIGKAKEFLRTKFPDHPDFQGLSSDEHPSWFTSLLANFENECSKYHLQLKGHDDYAFGNTYCRPLVLDNSHMGSGLKTFDGKPDYYTLLDLNYFQEKLMKEARIEGSRHGDKSLQHRHTLNVTSESCARGGEPKFQNYSEWKWLPHLQAVDVGATELKTKQKYAMPMVPSKFNYRNDFYHSWASWCAVSDALHRTEADRANGIHTFVFLDLHRMKDASVAKHITEKIIRGNIPNDCPKQLKNELSSRSIRKGMIETLATHNGLNNPWDTCALTGHSTGTSVDSYLDKSSVIRALPAAKAIAGWKDVRSVIYVPNLDCLGEHLHSTLLSLMEELYVNSISYFKLGQPLHKVLCTGTATLIMYHPQVTKDLGTSNALSMRLRQAARRANITDALHPNIAPETLLDVWAAKIETDFRIKNPEIRTATPDVLSLTATCNQMASNLQSLMVEVKMMREDREQERAAAVQDRLSVSNRVTNLENENAELRQALLNAQAKLACIKTPQHERPFEPTPSRNVRMRLSYASSNATVSSTTTNNKDATPDGNITSSPAKSPANRISPPIDTTAVASTTTAATASTNTTATATTTTAPRPVIQVQLRNTSKRTGSNSNITIVNMLDHLHSLKKLTCLPIHSIKSGSIPSDYKEKSQVKYCLELVDKVATREEKQKLRAKQPTGEAKADILEMYAGIQKRAFEKMWEYEGEDIELKKQLEAARKGNKTQPTYQALGKRVLAYKQHIYEAKKKQLGNNQEEISNLPKARDTELCERNNIPKPTEPGTPKGYRNITTYLGQG